MVTTRRVRGHYPKPELSKSRFVTRRVVADFSTLPELVKHARSMDGATHIAGHGSETRIYFPRGDGQYEEATVWQKGNYWHALGPGARQVVRRLPQGAKPLTGREMRWASEEREAGSKMHAWDVILNNRRINRVFFDSDMTRDDVKRSLVEHDGLPSNIKVILDTKALSGRSVRDYAAIDNRGRTTAGPFKTYGDAKQAAGPAGSVKFVPGKRASEAHERAGDHEIMVKHHNGFWQSLGHYPSESAARKAGETYVDQNPGAVWMFVASGKRATQETRRSAHHRRR